LTGEISGRLKLIPGLNRQVSKVQTSSGESLSGLMLNPQASVKLVMIGKEKQPLFVVDDLILQPERLVDFACDENTGFSEDETDFYPGVRKLLPQDYSGLISQFSHSLLLSYLDATQNMGISITLSALSITQQNPESLIPIQCIPHFDTCDIQQWAVVHFLCTQKYGGTGFFRHRQSGFETITQDRKKRYTRILTDEAHTKGLPPASYLQGDNELFEQTYSIESKFNRALFYPSNILHSGLVKHWKSHNIRSSRLTANCFLQLKE
jgi:hypothetical protein